MKSFNSKIFLTFSIVILFLICIAIFVSLQSIQKYFEEDSIQQTKNQNLLISREISDYYRFEDRIKNLNNEIVKLNKLLKLDLTVINLKKEIIFSSDKNPDISEIKFGKSEFIKFYKNYLKNENYVEIIKSKDSVIFITPILKDKEIVGFVITKSYNIANFKKLSQKILNFSLILLAVIFIFGASYTFLISERYIKPISDLTYASRRVILEDFDNIIEFSGDDEIALLARNFNQMSQKLKNYYLISESSQEQYLILISSIQSSLVVLDNKGKVVLHNTSFEKLIKSKIAHGKHFWDLIDSKELKHLIKSVNSENKHNTKEIEIENLFFLCSANYLETKQEVVILFHDITGIKQFENVKRDFVVNVTHELRTPLTAIKGFIETIEDNINEEDFRIVDNVNYIQIIKRHTQRLINIVEDLLTLSEIEQKNSLIQKSSTDISQLFENLHKIFEQRINDKNLKFIIEIAENLPLFTIDSFRIEQVLINLIDNAIKYTETGFVRIAAYKKDNCGILEIQDTGIGIPKEHHNRLFERFYTVDKSRSRKVGGTGLGLSIVKHIIQLHNGNISIDSAQGRGTKYTISLPL